jgi:SAM-dependent methyltransferase
MTRPRKLLLKLFALGGLLWRRLRGTEWKTHPIDKLYGIETSRRVSKRALWTGSALDAGNVGYVGTEPSVLRTCLALFSINPEWAFMDLGCGKGRALAVATEYPFGRIVGIELSPLLYEIAQSNREALAALRPSRLVEIILGDATQFDLPSCATAIVYLYNPFGKPLVERTILQIKKHLAARPGLKIFVIYCNPVHYQSFDSCRTLSRLFAGKIDFSAAERTVAPVSAYDSVLIYQSSNGAMLIPLPGADAQVKITVPDLGAEIVS